MKEEKEIKMDFQPIESVDNLFQRMHGLLKTTSPPDAIMENVGANRFRMALFDVLIEKKEELAHTYHDFRFDYNDMHNVDNMLEECFTNAQHGAPKEEEDDQHSDIDEEFKMQMHELKQKYNEQTEAICKNANEVSNKMKEVMERHKKFRPVSEADLDKAVNSVHSAHHKVAYRLKQETCNQAMILSNGCLDARRKRRNFSKEATAHLQEFFHQNREHPYPTDEQKQELAHKCNITVQQVSNWFGNRRIRYKKTQNMTSELETPQPMDQGIHGYTVDPSLLMTQPLPVPYPIESQFQMFPSVMFDPSHHDVASNNIQLSAVYSSSMAYIDQQ